MEKRIWFVKQLPMRTHEQEKLFVILVLLGIFCNMNLSNCSLEKLFFSCTEHELSEHEWPFLYPILLTLAHQRIVLESSKEVL